MYAEDVEVTVAWRWEQMGEVRIRQNGTFEHVDAPREPGVYRIRVNEGGEQVHVYVGEAVSLHRRIREDIRRLAVDFDLRDLLQRGGNVRVDRAMTVTATMQDGAGRSSGNVSLDVKFTRLMVEGLALGVESPTWGILNKHRGMP